MEKIDQGAVTASYKADRERVIEVLNDVLATETVCVLRYKSHYYRAKGVHAPGVAERVPRARHRGAAARRPRRQAASPSWAAPRTSTPRASPPRSHAQYGGGRR